MLSIEANTNRDVEVSTRDNTIIKLVTNLLYNCPSQLVNRY
jgi:hypothetical protein